MKKLLLAASFIFALGAHAQEFTFGAGLGPIVRGNQRSFAGGLHFNVNPIGWLAADIAATYSCFGELPYMMGSSKNPPTEKGCRYFNMITPGIIFYPIDFDFIKLGALGGPGLYRYEGFKNRWGWHAGLVGDFSPIGSWAFGARAEYHVIAGNLGNGGVDAWTLLATAAYRFSIWD